MPRYQLNEPHFLDNKYFEGGAIIDWEGPPGRHMTPIEEVAEQRKARYDENRPHMRASRDLPPKFARATAVHNPATVRQPGMPRVAGPPGQMPTASADPASPEKTAALVEERKAFNENDAKAREAALEPSNEPKAEPETEKPAATTRRKK